MIVIVLPFLFHFIFSSFCVLCRRERRKNCFIIQFRFASRGRKKKCVPLCCIAKNILSSTEKQIFFSKNTLNTLFECVAGAPWIILISIRMKLYFTFCHILVHCNGQQWNSVCQSNCLSRLNYRRRKENYEVLRPNIARNMWHFMHWI